MSNSGTEYPYQVDPGESNVLVQRKEQERRDLLEILEDRYGTRSTVMTSQLPPAKWHDHLGDPTLADAVCDRILHNAHRLTLKGPSRRKEESAKE